MDKLRSMAVFVAVVEAGSFTQAAVRLEISAVMVGKYIAQLENSLATRLLARNTRRQSLTDAGRVFYEEARRVLEQVHIAETSVERLRAAPAGTLRVTASTTFGGCVIAPITATFLTAWPQVRVDLDLSNRSVDLLEEGFDLAIRIGAVSSEDVVVKPLCLYRMVICAAPAYLARYGEPASPEALRDHRCLSNGVWNRRNEWKLPGEAGEMSWQRDPVLRCNDGQGLRMAAIAGAGLLLQPEILVREELANGTLVRIMQPFTPRPRPVNLVYRQESRPLPKLTHYIEHLHHEITQWVAA